MHLYPPRQDLQGADRLTQQEQAGPTEPGSLHGDRTVRQVSGECCERGPAWAREQGRAPGGHCASVPTGEQSVWSLLTVSQGVTPWPKGSREASPGERTINYLKYFKIIFCIRTETNVKGG